MGRESQHLGEILGAEPRIASVPGGMTRDAVIETAALAGYRVLMTSEPNSALRVESSIRTVGRYGIWSTTPATRAVAYARGAWSPRARLWIEWNVKALGKRVSSGLYQHARRVRARRA